MTKKNLEKQDIKRENAPEQCEQVVKKTTDMISQSTDVTDGSNNKSNEVAEDAEQSNEVVEVANDATEIAEPTQQSNEVAEGVQSTDVADDNNNKSIEDAEGVQSTDVADGSNNKSNEVAEDAEVAEKTQSVEVVNNATDIAKPTQQSIEDAEDEDYLLVVKDLKQYFPIKKSIIKEKSVYLKAVDGVSLKLKHGKTVGIVGESGCGKTTLGRTILRLYEPTAGEIIFNGKHIEKLKGEALRKERPNFQMIFQDPYSSLSPRLTVGEIVGEAVRTHKIVPKSEYKDYVRDIMQKCGLQPHFFNRYPHEFSGGQRQRICIAKALALKPQLVICDEPVSALDVSIQAQVINLFKDLQESDNLAYIFISHDLSVVEHISHEVGVMYLGNLVEYGLKKDLFDNPMHPYTQALFSAVPIPDPDTKIKRIILQGDIPSPANPPKGCKFHTRCNKCMDICKEVEPKFKDYGNGHCVACHLYPQD